MLDFRMISPRAHKTPVERRGLFRRAPKKKTPTLRGAFGDNAEEILIVDEAKCPNYLNLKKVGNISDSGFFFF